MIKYLTILLLFSLVSCSQETKKNYNQSEIKNEIMREYKFLKYMYEDDYFPNFLVDKCKGILIHLCLEIEKEKPKNLDELYVLTHKATVEINKLQDEFYKNDSEIETMAREIIALDFEVIAKKYGFGNADMEELIAPRDW